MYILASFVEDKVSIGVWIYFWAFYFVPLIYISVFVPVPYCLDDCGFVFLGTASVLVSGQLVMAITPTAASVSD